MLNENQTDNSDKAVFAALIGGGFVWVVFDSFAFGIIAGLIAFIAVNKKSVSRDNRPADAEDK